MFLLFFVLSTPKLVHKQALVIGFEEAYPLWALSTPDVGGLGWGTIDIGKVRTTKELGNNIIGHGLRTAIVQQA